eukprot:CAMPEP_0184412690 /NCGR_PEP_ID=MMETSP0738-20130409/6650_1 /TAXON_ID=385413 /ORGANISM="Thalassiosira miniscula, Strain CCMP1093" /LENGTH=71 /DNA_ID=CAMNT_0026771251 /DNA_START=15 /DNA_END=226 /DNA_ORIENTATION=-
MIPGAANPTFRANIVAINGLNADAVEWAKSYPNEADVKRTFGGNLSTNQALIGPPKIVRKSPIVSCAKNAG